MGMIRVSDEVEGRLKEVADGRSMNAVIEKMLAYCSSPTGFCPAPKEGQNYEPYILEHLDERLDKLESLIEDTAVDRLDGGNKGRVGGAKHFPLCWENCLQEVYFEFEDSDPCWLPGVKEGWGASDFMDTAIFESDGDYVYDVTHNKFPVLKVTPELREFLNKRGFRV